MRPYFERNGVQIFHGDARDVLPDLEDGSVAALITDPPYGMAYQPMRKCGLAAKPVRADGARQGVRVLRGVLQELEPKLSAEAHAYVFCRWDSWPDFHDALAGHLPMKNALIWHKAQGGMGNTKLAFALDYEVILYAALGGQLHGRRDGAVLTGFRPVPPAKRIHTTEKPVELLAYLIEKSTRPGDLVVDPFMGSGSLLEAALRTGRRALCVELDEEYCEVASKRLEACSVHAHAAAPSASA